MCNRVRSHSSLRFAQYANLSDRMHLLLGRSPGWWVLFLPSGFLLICGAVFGTTAHDAAHGTFMTLPFYTQTREGEVPQLCCGSKPCRPSFQVRKCSRTILSLVTC